MSRVHWLPLALLVAGCADATTPTVDGVQLLPEHTAYTLGDTVHAKLSNRSGAPIGYGACSLSLEHQTASGWIRVSPDPVYCIAILYGLDSGQHVVRLQVIDPALSPGAYRLRQWVLPDTRLPVSSVFSPVFVVRAPTETISVSLSNTEAFSYATVGGDEEGARIAVQPKHAMISEIRRGAETNWVATYVYQAKPGYIGSDSVRLEILTGSDGASPPDIRTLVIEFDIHE
jgi:hypothetical protein